ncbi:hypothetical protein BGX38DRAFT_1183407 [Terfezia claveryi]|nr:hypothetical protein BGX38DRAFT_1183407 [Terfezia claveryi]
MYCPTVFVVVAGHHPWVDPDPQARDNLYSIMSASYGGRSEELEVPVCRPVINPPPQQSCITPCHNSIKVICSQYRKQQYSKRWSRGIDSTIITFPQCNVVYERKVDGKESSNTSSTSDNKHPQRGSAPARGHISPNTFLQSRVYSCSIPSFASEFQLFYPFRPDPNYFH